MVGSINHEQESQRLSLIRVFFLEVLCIAVLFDMGNARYIKTSSRNGIH